MDIWIYRPWITLLSSQDFPARQRSTLFGVAVYVLWLLRNITLKYTLSKYWDEGLFSLAHDVSLSRVKKAPITNRKYTISNNFDLIGIFCQTLTGNFQSNTEWKLFYWCLTGNFQSMFDRKIPIKFFLLTANNRAIVLMVNWLPVNWLKKYSQKSNRGQRKPVQDLNFIWECRLIKLWI